MGHKFLILIDLVSKDCIHKLLIFQKWKCQKAIQLFWHQSSVSIYQSHSWRERERERAQIYYYRRYIASPTLIFFFFKVDFFGNYHLMLLKM